MGLNHVVVKGDDVRALVVVDEVEILQRRNDVLLFDAGRFTNFTAKSERKKVLKPKKNLSIYFPSHRSIG